MNRIVILALGLGALSLALLFALQTPQQQNLLFVGGTILSMAEPTNAEALWIHEGRIAAIGSEAALREKATDARVINLAGATLMSGFIEPHTHPLATAMLGQTIDISGFAHKDRASIMSALKKAANGIAWREWIVAFGWDPAMLDDLDPPTLAELDAIAPDRPLVVLTQMMHDAYLNSTALAAAGITADTPNPTGAEFARDANGQLTGTVREVRAIEHVFNAMPAVPKGAPALLLNRQYAAYAAKGYTTLGALGPVGRSDDPIGLMQQLANDPAVTVQTVVYGLPDQLKDARWRPGLSSGDGRFILRGVKFWLDGSPWAGGAAWDEAYADSPFVRERLHLPPGHRGSLNYSDAEFSKIFSSYHAQGYQIAMHVQGERAVRQAMKSVQAALHQHPRQDHRHRLEHNALITDDQLRHLQQLGMTPSFFIDHIRYYGHRLSDLVGDKRAARYMPVGSAFANGHRATLHADSPGTRIDPLRLMQTAMLRHAEQGNALIGPDQRISIEQALQAITINAAWQLGVEQDRGSLEVGKAADLVLLSANPLETPPALLTDIEVLDTWVAGRLVNTGWLTRQNLSLLWQLLKNALSS